MCDSERVIWVFVWPSMSSATALALALCEDEIEFVGFSILVAGRGRFGTFFAKADSMKRASSSVIFCLSDWR